MSHSPEYWTRPHTESVVLDIGDDVGALLLYTPALMRSREIEVSPVDDDSARVHTGVLERSFNGRTAFVAVYPELRAGTYRVWIDSEPTVTITAGSVAELDAS